MQSVVDATHERPWLWAVIIVVVVLPLVLIVVYCCMSTSKVSLMSTVSWISGGILFCGTGESVYIFSACVFNTMQQ